MATKKIAAGTYRFKDKLTIPSWLTDKIYIPIGFTTPTLWNTGDVAGVIIPSDGTDIYDTCILLYSDAVFAVIYKNSENLSNIICYSEENAWNDLASSLEKTGFTNSDIANGYGQTVTVPSDTVVDIDDDVFDWLKENVVSTTIKAGTYRWNDVLTPSTTAISASIPFTINCKVTDIDTNDSFEVFAEGDSIIFYTDGLSDSVLFYNVISATPDLGATFPQVSAVYNDGWDWVGSVVDDRIRNITVTKDTTVYDAFGAWFEANTEAVTTSTKKFTRLYLGDVAYSSGGKCFKRLTTEEPKRTYSLAVSIPIWFVDVETGEDLGRIISFEYGKTYKAYSTSSTHIYILRQDADANKLSVAQGTSANAPEVWEASAVGNELRALICTDSTAYGTDTEYYFRVNVPAGLYDADDNLVASWDTLVNTYGMDCEKDYTYSSSRNDETSPYVVFGKISGEKKLIIDDTVTSIGEFAFYGTSLTSVIIGNGVTSIGARAFTNCDSLTSVVIGNSVTSIVNGAFESCDSLTSVKIPDSVTSIDEFAFMDCTSLTSIVIPNSVTIIGRLAFSGSSITSIVIPDGVTSIELSTFNRCESLASIVIPDSVTSIGYRAFVDCKSLTDVYYKGTEAQWSQIAIDEYNEKLTDATINYNYVPS